jgi:predicted nucleic acid-binding protein
MTAAIVDTGPLVAFFDRSDRYHRWAARRIEELQAPLLLCEPVLAEATYLLARHSSRAPDALLQLLKNGALAIGLRVDQHVDELCALLQKYRDTPMSLADACVVRMAEIHAHHAVFTLDSDFLVYRVHGRAPLELIRPPGR